MIITEDKLADSVVGDVSCPHCRDEVIQQLINMTYRNKDYTSWCGSNIYGYQTEIWHTIYILQ